MMKGRKSLRGEDSQAGSPNGSEDDEGMRSPTSPSEGARGRKGQVASVEDAIEMTG